MLELAIVVGVMRAQADPLARCPLCRNITEQVQAILVIRGQIVKVGAVLAEAFSGAQISLQQGGVERPVQRFNIGVAPQAVVVAQALATQSQLFAGVGGEAFVADPEFTQGQVAFIRGARIVAAGLLLIGLLQGVGFDDVAGRHRLPHHVGTPVAMLEIRPWAQVKGDTVDVAAVTGAKVAVVFGLRGDFGLKAEVLFIGQGGQGRA